MQSLKQIGAVLFALLALLGLLGLAEIALMKTLHLIDSAPPADAILKMTALALVSATICVALLMSAAKDRKAAEKSYEDEKVKK